MLYLIQNVYIEYTPNSSDRVHQFFKKKRKQTTDLHSLFCFFFENNKQTKQTSKISRSAIRQTDINVEDTKKHTQNTLHANTNAQKHETAH